VIGSRLAVLVSLCSSAAFGQALPCPDIANDAERLACYDRALRPNRAPAAAAAPASAPAPAAAKNESVTIVITSVRSAPGRPVTFTAADGTVWAQNDGQTISFRLPETPFDAELKPGAMGSQFLLPKGVGRSVRVRLVR